MGSVMLSLGLILYVVASCLHKVASGQDNPLASTSQLIEEGKSGTVSPTGQHCPGSFLVLWHDGGSSDDPIIMKMIDLNKTGDGYLSGEYDIMENGSLWIRKVTSRHDHCFFVQFRHRNFSGSTEKICVTVLVKPRKPHPVIRPCPQRRHCLIMKQNNENVTCVVRKTRPPVELSWSRKLTTGYIDLHTQHKTSGDYLLNTEANTSVTFSNNAPFQLLRCSANALTGQLDSLESFALVENSDRKRQEENFQFRSVELHAALFLPCGSTTSQFIVWKKVNQSTIGYVIDGERVMSDEDLSAKTERYEIADNGSLVIRDVSIQHEHRFECIYSDDDVHYEVTYQLAVIVKPDVPHPAIDVCQNARWCFKTLEEDSTIVCTVANTRPKADITWSRKTAKGYREWNYTSEVAEKDGRFTTIAQATVTVPEKQSFSVLRCETTGVAGQFDSQESFVLVEVRNGKRLGVEDVGPVHINVSETLNLPCGTADSVFVVWRLKSVGTIGYVIEKEAVVNVSVALKETAYKLDKNGSLQIYNLSYEKEHQFECVHGDGEREERHHYVVSLHVKPAVPYPVIDVCQNERLCYKPVEVNSSIKCVVENTNPKVNLTWSRKRAMGYEERSHTHDVIGQNGTSTTLAEIAVTFSEEQSFSLLRCEATGIAGQFDSQEAFVLVEVDNHELLESEDVDLVKINASEYLSLECGDPASFFVVWKMKSVGTIGYVLFTGNDTKVNMSDEVDTTKYRLKDDGSLEIFGFSSESETHLDCIYGDGDAEERRHFIVSLPAESLTPKSMAAQIYRLLLFSLVLVPTLLTIRICKRFRRGHRITRLFSLNTNGRRRETFLYICRADTLPQNQAIAAYSKLFTHVIFDDRRRLLEHLNRYQGKNDSTAVHILCFLCNYNMKLDAKELSEYVEDNCRHTFHILLTVLRPETMVVVTTAQKNADIIVVLFDGNNPKFEAQERAFVDQTKNILKDLNAESV